MEESTSLLTEYQPFDISSIKQIKYISDKEFETESNNICDLLKDISKIYIKLIYFIEADWDKRLKALLAVQQYIVSD